MQWEGGQNVAHTRADVPPNVPVVPFSDRTSERAAVIGPFTAAAAAAVVSSRLGRGIALGHLLRRLLAYGAVDELAQSVYPRVATSRRRTTRRIELRRLWKDRADVYRAGQLVLRRGLLGPQCLRCGGCEGLGWASGAALLREGGRASFSLTKVTHA